jgi:hypothetical protein
VSRTSSSSSSSALVARAAWRASVRRSFTA